MRDTERRRDIGRGRSRLPAGSPTDVRLDPGTPGSCPELKADAQLLSHPGIPREKSLIRKPQTKPTEKGVSAKQ